MLSPTETNGDGNGMNHSRRTSISASTDGGFTSDSEAGDVPENVTKSSDIPPLVPKAKKKKTGLSASKAIHSATLTFVGDYLNNQCVIPRTHRTR